MAPGAENENMNMNDLYKQNEALLFDMADIEVIPEQSNTSSNCKSGMIAEMIFAIEAAKRGFTIFFPIGHSQKADLIAWKPPARPISVQIKKATYQKESGSWKFMVGSGKPSCAANPNNYGLRYTAYKKGDFDILCAYIEERGEFLFYTLCDIAGCSSRRWHPSTGFAANNWDILDL